MYFYDGANNQWFTTDVIVVFDVVGVLGSSQLCFVYLFNLFNIH